MFKPNFQITIDIVKALGKIERCQGFFDAHRLFETQENKVDHPFNCAELISKIDPDNGKQLQGYREVFSKFTNYYLTQEISEVLICDMHARLFSGAITNPQALGKYRTTQNYIYKSENNKILYTPTAPEKISKSVADLLRWLKSENFLPPLIKIVLAHVQFLNIHPFTDGNGRTGQLLTMVLLHQAGYEFKDYFAIGEVYLKDRNNYHDALQSCRGAANNMTKAIEYILSHLAMQMGELEKGVKSYHQGKRVEKSKPLGGRLIFAATKKI